MVLQTENRTDCDLIKSNGTGQRAIDDNGMVSLEKKSPEERLNICRKYYLGGFAFLPLLWLINAVWFYKQAFKVDPYPQQAQIRTCNDFRYSFFYH